MSKKVKVLISVLAAVVLLTVGSAATVMAQEETTPAPETNTTSTNGLFARVADKLGITEEELNNAFEEARQELREEAFIRWLDKAVEEGRITEDEAEEIEEWWGQRPEALDEGLLKRAMGAFGIRGRLKMLSSNRAGEEVGATQEQANRIRAQWENRQAGQGLQFQGVRISRAMRNCQQITVPENEED